MSTQISKPHAYNYTCYTGNIMYTIHDSMNHMTEWPQNKDTNPKFIYSRQKYVWQNNTNMTGFNRLLSCGYDKQTNRE